MAISNAPNPNGIKEMTRATPNGMTAFNELKTQ